MQRRSVGPARISVTGGPTVNCPPTDHPSRAPRFVVNLHHHHDHKNIYSRISQVTIHIHKCLSTCGKNKSMDFVFLICALVALFLFWVNSFQWSGFRQTFHLSNNLHKHHQYGHLLSHKPLPRKRLIHCPEWHLGNAEPLSQSDTANMRPERRGNMQPTGQK